MIDDPMTQDQALGIIRGIVAQRQAEPEPFAELVRRMRRAQMLHSGSRSQVDSIEARRLERLVDTHLRNLEMGDRP